MMQLQPYVLYVNTLSHDKPKVASLELLESY